ncbi:LysR family transcriptional regulator [Achromobacter aloeverae]|uniref:LysR family transcriptional regulator n=1 Tax=Achromobacter aloeverae TaxID=1750518 RepID=UPI001864D33D|nr:LysR family transcriptional regulator [Achromobacter aloeverae]
MNLRTLKYFVAIADAGSLTAAAEAIAIAQPALSRQMHALEEEMGVPLLQRTARGVRLTQAGVTLYEAAQRMLDEAQRVKRQLAGPSEAGESRVVLGVSPTLSRVLVPGLFERCHRTMDQMRLTVREAFTPELLDMLEKGMVDMAIITSMGASADRPLALHPLVGEPFALATPRSMKMDPIISLAALSRIPLLMTTLHRTVVERQLRPMGVHLNIHSEIDSVDAIRELVHDGDWCTLMPVSVFKEARSDAGITLTEVSGVQLNRQLMMATRIEAVPSTAVAALREIVLAELARLNRLRVFNFGKKPVKR